MGRKYYGGGHDIRGIFEKHIYPKLPTSKRVAQDISKGVQYIAKYGAPVLDITAAGFQAKAGDYTGATYNVVRAAQRFYPQKKKDWPKKPYKSKQWYYPNKDTSWKQRNYRNKQRKWIPYWKWKLQQRGYSGKQYGRKRTNYYNRSFY